MLMEIEIEIEIGEGEGDQPRSRSRCSVGPRQLPPSVQVQEAERALRCRRGKEMGVFLRFAERDGTRVREREMRGFSARIEGNGYGSMGLQATVWAAQR
ncbi:hypothetical protein ACFX1X_036325 [Malus domestica]